MYEFSYVCYSNQNLSQSKKMLYHFFDIRNGGTIPIVGKCKTANFQCQC